MLYHYIISIGTNQIVPAFLGQEDIDRYKGVQEKIIHQGKAIEDKGKQELSASRGGCIQKTSKVLIP